MCRRQNLQITFLIPFVTNTDRIQKQQIKEWLDKERWLRVKFVTDFTICDLFSTFWLFFYIFKFNKTKINFCW